MKKVKLIIPTALIAAVAFYSSTIDTYGIFTSKASEGKNTFQAGTLKVMLDAENAKSASQTLSLDYGKLSAGDSVSKKFYIKNSGSLPFVSKISIGNKCNPIFGYLMCQVNIYYKEESASRDTECKYTLYRGSLSEFAKTANRIEYQEDANKPAVSQLTPSESIKCEIILTLPEDVVLPDEVVRSAETKESSDKGKNQWIGIKIDTSQVNNTEF